MATISDFYSYVMPSVQGCPVQLVINAIRCSINDFCERTLMWRTAFTPTDVVAGQRGYTFTPTAGTVIYKPTYVGVNSFSLQPTNVDDLDTTMAGWRDSTSSQPTMYFMDYNSILNIIPTPTATITGGLQFEAALKLASSADSVPDWLLNSWAEVIAHGALMRLHAMPGKSWSDPNTVVYHRSKFREGITHAKSRTMKSFVKQGKAVQPRHFW